MKILFGLVLVCLSSFAIGADDLTLLTAKTSGSTTQYSTNLQVIVLMTVLTLLPSILLMMTSFVRILIVLSILRQAIGLGQTPPNMVLVGMSLFLTFFIMSPVLDETYVKGVKPFLDAKIEAPVALEEGSKPIKSFMLKNTREEDLRLFMEISKKKADSPQNIPLTTLVPAFITSELKSAFTIGFLLYIPFIVIDLIVASVLMSLGMMMLSPMMIALPLKLLVFVLVDGWSMIMGSLASSFQV